MYAKYIKRFLDFSLSLIALVVLSPVYLLLAVLVRIKLGKPVLFSQERTGKDQKHFKIYKFRTMTDQRDENGKLLPDEARLTRFGKVLRSTSLDELPELLNILKGEMSIIGPRPLMAGFDSYYTEREKLRFRVRGGLIPPEILYNNVLPTWDEQLEYEASYAEKICFALDVALIIAVFKGLFSRYEKDYGEYVRKGLDEERAEREGRVSKV